MVSREKEISETAPGIVAARHRRVAAGPPSPEPFKGKLDSRIAKFAVGATLVALGVISFARPAIDSAASVDVLAHPPYPPTPTEIVEPRPLPAAPTFAEDIDDYACDMRDYLVPDCDDSSSPVINRYSSSDDDSIACTNFDAVHGGGSFRLTCTFCPAKSGSYTHVCNPTPTPPPHSITPTEQPKP